MSGGKFTALLIAQCCLCGVWAVGAWFYFHRQPLEACEARATVVRRQLDAMSAREELRATEVWLLRGDYATALEHLPVARQHARQAGYQLDQDFDDVDRLLCGGEEVARERVALLASRLLPSAEPRRPVSMACAPSPAPDVLVKRAPKKEAPAAPAAAAPDPAPAEPQVAPAAAPAPKAQVARGKSRHHRADKKKVKAGRGKRKAAATISEGA